MGNGGAIRVESNEVLVPVVVLDKKRVAELQAMSYAAFGSQMAAGSSTVWEGIAVRDLNSRDFRLFEDGAARQIASVTLVPLDTPLIRDNSGRYREFVGIGGGTWTERAWEDTFRDYIPAGSRVLDWPPLPSYVIAYSPTEGSDGSCHQVVVEVDRPNTLVYSRSEFCNARNSPADPMTGTKIGKQLETALLSNKDGRSNVSVAAIPFFDSDGRSLTRVVVEFPSKSVEDACTTEPDTVGVLGVVSTKGGEEFERFGDLAYWSVANGSAVGDLIPLLRSQAYPNAQCVFDGPLRYETQLHLRPGEYDLRVELMDGKKFGRAEASFTVDSYDNKRLAISGVALARRFGEAPVGSQGVPTALPENFAPLVTKGVEVTPTANTDFKKDDPFYFYCQVLVPAVAGPPSVQAHLQILDLKTGETVKQLQPVDAAPYAVQGSPIVPIGGGVDIKSLPKGSYQLQVRAVDSGGQTTAWHSADFTIR